MDEIASKALFTQVRVAHRLLAAYYQKIQHLIEEVTNDERLDLGFYFWSPTSYSAPLRPRKNQLKQWSWDLLPGVLTEYVFTNGEIGNKRLGDWILKIHVVTDTGVEREETVQNPLEIKSPPEEGESVVRFYIVAPRKHVSGDWYGRVKGALSDLEYGSETPTCMDIEENIYAGAFEVPMEKLTAKGSAEELITKLEIFRGLVLDETSNLQLSQRKLS